jgi:hypothetical protein
MGRLFDTAIESLKFNDFEVDFSGEEYFKEVFAI